MIRSIKPIKKPKAKKGVKSDPDICNGCGYHITRCRLIEGRCF